MITQIITFFKCPFSYFLQLNKVTLDNYLS